MENKEITHSGPNYYAIIPAPVRYDRELKASEKLIYGEITALANKNGYCWASNHYFANLYGVHKKTVSNWISNLEKQGYLTIKLEYVKGTKQVAKRFIYINDNPSYQKGERLSTQTEGRYLLKDSYPIHEKTEEELNITSINNTSTNNIIEQSFQSDMSDKSSPVPYQEIVDYLNEKANRKYRFTTKKTQNLIKERWNENFQLHDFKQVIDNKVADWLNDDKMSAYLRPETLFGTKFEGYLNQKPIHKSESSVSDVFRETEEEALEVTFEDLMKGREE